MTSQPPRTSEPAPAGTSRETAEARIAALRAEVEAVVDRGRQAVLAHEIGVVYERVLKNDHNAVKEYLGAYNLDPTFRPPLFALLRIFERRRSIKNLSRLYEAEARSASGPQEKSSALVDRGVLAEDFLDQSADARALFEEALESDPESSVAALMLERHALAAGDAAGAQDAIAKRALTTHDAVMRGLLLVETAWAKEGAGDVDGALAMLEEAARLPAGRWRTLRQLERLARKHNKWAELVSALERRAEMAAAGARGEDPGDGSGAFSVKRFADAQRAGAEAVALWLAAARVKISNLGDAPGAAQLLSQALALRPDDLVIRLEHMHASELAGDVVGSADDARLLLERGATGPRAASLHFRLAELAQTQGDAAGAVTALAAALEADPGSAPAAALMDDLLLDGAQHAERIARLKSRASSGETAARVQALWRAAHIASDEQGDFAQARVLFDEAVGLAEEKVPILRELFAAALRANDVDAASVATAALLAMGVQEEERGALLRDRWLLLRDSIGDVAGAREVLEQALEEPTANRWAPDAARVEAAAHVLLPMLAKAHLAIAERTTDDEAAAAHLCAAGRALARGGDEAGAMKVLRRALERSPGHTYAVALLEEILRSRGEAEAVVLLLREAAAAQAGPRAAEMSLLLAGAAAEASGDMRVAIKTYEEAAAKDATGVASLFALRRVAIAQDDVALLLSTREALAEREKTAGQPGRASVELGDHLDFLTKKPELARAAYAAAIEDSQVGPTAAAALMLSAAADAEARVAAAARLLREVEEAGAPGLWRELGALALVSGSDAGRADEAVGNVLAAVPSDRWGSWARLRALGADPLKNAERADWLQTLAGVTGDSGLAAELKLHGMRAKTVAVGEQANDDAVIVAAELAEADPSSFVAAIALDETLTPGDDASSRADALSARLYHSEAEGRGALEAALGRALFAANRSADALETLRATVLREPDDLASWETLRVAARETEAYADEVRACDRLAEACEGRLRAELLEEAGAVLMDQLEDDAGAEKRLRAALAIDTRRPIAYGRLHDLLAERDDATGLLDVVQQKLDATDDSEELARLFYEQARLYRSLSDREGTLAAIDSLLMLDAHHVGGLGLQVETFVSLEKWAEAVDTLRTLAEADVPAAQRRIVRLGAADFLEHKLDDPRGALEELAALDAIGLADLSVYERMADVAERAGMHAEAVQSLARAAALATDDARAALERRAGHILASKLDSRDAAVDAYRRALEAVPDDVEAAEALAELVVDPIDRRTVVEGFDAAVRVYLDLDPTDPDTLRKLLRVAAWLGERDRAHAVLGALAAIGAATLEEENTLATLSDAAPRLPSRVLGPSAIGLFAANGDGGAWAQMSELCAESFTEIDGLEPGKYGVGRGDRVGPKDQSGVRDEVLGIARVLGVASGELYVGGSDNSLVAVLPRFGDPPAWVVGSGVSAPLSRSRRFQVARLAWAVRSGTVSLVSRSPAEAAALLASAAAGAETPLTGFAGTVDDLVRKGMTRKARKGLPEIVRSLPDGGADVLDYCRAVHQSAAAAGAMFSGDIAMALEIVLGRKPERESVQTSPAATELLKFWISMTALELRRELGLGT